MPKIIIIANFKYKSISFDKKNDYGEVHIIGFDFGDQSFANIHFKQRIPYHQLTIEICRNKDGDLYINNSYDSDKVTIFV